MEIRAKDVTGRQAPERCRPPESCARSKGNHLNVWRNPPPGNWPVWTDLSELTGWDVQVRCLGEWPEPSAGELDVCAMYNVGGDEF